MDTITYASHVAHIDPLTGEGLLILPHPDWDMPGLTGPTSLHAADWNAVVRHLDGLGWEPSEDEDAGGWTYVGSTSDGRDVVGLYGREPINSMPTLDHCTEALSELRRVAGVSCFR